ncbi:MAG: ATP-binding protein [Treponema sp.]|nr:ATP-binding protein [Treponema sp.]
MNNKNRKKSSFKNKVLLPVIVIFTVSILLASAINFTHLHSIVETKNTANLEIFINDVFLEIRQLNIIMETVKQTLNEKHLAIAKTLANWITAGIIHKELEYLASFLDIIELNIVNQNGILIASNVLDLPGFDYKEYETTNKYMGLISGTLTEIAEEPRLSVLLDGSTGSMNHYVGVPLPDGRGFIQIGFNADVIIKLQDSIEIEEFIVDAKIGHNGYGMVLSEGKVIALPCNSTLDRNIAEEDWYKTVTSGDGFSWVTINNERFFSGYKSEYNNTVVGLIPIGDYYSELKQLLVQTVLLMLAAIVVMITSIYMVLGKLLSPVKHLISGLHRIAEGEYNARIEGNFNDELDEIKDAINSMAENKKVNDEQMQIIFEATPLGANLWNRDIQNIRTNDEAVRLFGLADKQDYLDNFSVLSPEHQPDGQLSSEKAARLVRKAFEEGYTRFEWIHQKLDGEQIPCEITLVRVKYKNDYVVAGYTRDLREMKAYIAEMQKTIAAENAKNIAEQSNRSKDIFLAHMSHEIRTPMNAILGISEIQLFNEHLSKDVKEEFIRIYESGNLLLNIINNILDFSKIEADKMEIVPNRYDVPSLVNDTVQLNRLHYDNKPIDFILQVDENTPYELIGDELRIKQILNNLLSNAFKYTETGEVELSISAESKQDNETVTLILSVRDTGQGLKEDQVARLFDEYSRFNLETNRGISGTGLGMNITKRLIDMMNGEITVESKVDAGTAFTVRLPQERSSPAVCGADIAERLQNFSYHNTSILKKTQIVHEHMPYGKVLVVDDVESNLYVAKGMLTPYRLQIETAKSGFEAIEKIKNNGGFDIVFMDHMMPKMNGIQAAKIIRDMGYTKPIVVLTADAVVGQAEMFLSNGFDGFLSKPINSHELDDLVKVFIRNKKPLEVIQAAQKNEIHEIEKCFILDARDAIDVLTDIYARINTLNNTDMESYTITVHGIKSALANIGETELSGIALRLENAGDSRNLAIIKDETPAFINALQSLIVKFIPAETGGDAAVSPDDTDFLLEKLHEIKTACEAFNVRAAKTALSDLKQKTWPHDINDVLDEISVRLLHGEFKRAISAAEKTVPETAQSYPEAK